MRQTCQRRFQACSLEGHNSSIRDLQSLSDVDGLTFNRPSSSDKTLQRYVPAAKYAALAGSKTFHSCKSVYQRQLRTKDRCSQCLSKHVSFWFSGLATDISMLRARLARGDLIGQLLRQLQEDGAGFSEPSGHDLRQLSMRRRAASCLKPVHSVAVSCHDHFIDSPAGPWRLGIKLRELHALIKPI